MCESLKNLKQTIMFEMKTFCRTLSQLGSFSSSAVKRCGAFIRATTPAADCVTLVKYALECAGTAASVNLNEDIFVG